MPRVIVGLGNPGKAYQYTRHNLGFLVVQRLAETCNISFKHEGAFDALFAKGVCQGEEVITVMPQTYMNLSGKSVGALLRYYKLSTSDLLVLVDDIALPFSKIRLRLEGGANGHNGLKSIRDSLGSAQFARLRLGIGEAHPKENLADYVLGQFTSQERSELNSFINKSVDAVALWIQDPKKAMDIINGQENTRSKEKLTAAQEQNDQVKD